MGMGKKKEPLIYKGSCGGRNRTRTCDPIDVNDVLSAGGKVYRKQMLGVHMPKNVDITGFPQFLAHPRAFAGWVFIGCSRHFEHRVFTGVFMGVHGSGGVHMSTSFLFPLLFCVANGLTFQETE